MLLLIRTKRFWVKILRVRGRTSLQSHNERSELHISFNSVKRIPVKTVHRMTRGWYLELAWGRPVEEDIVRYEDDYNRA